MKKENGKTSGVDHDLLDTLGSMIRQRSGFEATSENRCNTLVENHPYLVGYAFLLTLTILFSATHLLMFIMSFLFLYLISDFMANDVHRFAPFIPRVLLFSVLYILLLFLITVFTYKVIPNLVKNFPDTANQMQTQVVKQFKHATKVWGLSEYVDIDEVRQTIGKASTGILSYLMDSLTRLYKGFIQFIFALAINAFLYYDRDKIDRVFVRKPGSMMTFLYRFIEVRLSIFYFYFKRVMGGQLIIAAINTAISALVILLLNLPHPVLLISIVFVCGLFPVVGNLVSNSVLVITAFVSIGVWASLICLALLVGIHKLEYFLNSRIIGGIVRLPMTVTLGALIISEVLLGIPGLILAIPLTLFLRCELENIPGYPQGPPPVHEDAPFQPASKKDSAHTAASSDDDRKMAVL